MVAGAGIGGLCLAHGLRRAVVRRDGLQSGRTGRRAATRGSGSASTHRPRRAARMPAAATTRPAGRHHRRLLGLLDGWHPDLVEPDRQADVFNSSPLAVRYAKPVPPTRTAPAGAPCSRTRSTPCRPVAARVPTRRCVTPPCSPAPSRPSTAAKSMTGGSGHKGRSGAGSARGRVRGGPDGRRHRSPSGSVDELASVQ